MKRIKNFLFRWNELITIPIAILLFIFSPNLLRIFDPTAGSYDVGIFQIILFGIICFLIGQAFVWIIIGIIWPSIRQYFEKGFSKEFDTVTPWQRLKISLSVYFLLFLIFVLLTRVI